MQDGRWKLKFLEGNSETFASRVRAGDQIYAEYYDKYLQSPGASKHLVDAISV